MLLALLHHTSFYFSFSWILAQDNSNFHILFFFTVAKLCVNVEGTTADNCYVYSPTIKTFDNMVPKVQNISYDILSKREHVTIFYFTLTSDFCVGVQR